MRLKRGTLIEKYSPGMNMEKYIAGKNHSNRYNDWGMEMQPITQYFPEYDEGNHYFLIAVRAPRPRARLRLAMLFFTDHSFRLVSVDTMHDDEAELAKIEAEEIISTIERIGYRRTA